MGTYSEFWQKAPQTLLTCSGKIYEFARENPKEAALSAISVFLMYDMAKDISSVHCIDLYLLLVMNMPTIAALKWDVPNSLHSMLNN